MTLSAVEFSGPSPGTAGDPRSDTRQRAIVDDAIALLSTSNVMSAFEYLRARGIGGHVIERVLLDPLRRRSSL